MKCHDKEKMNALYHRQLVKSAKVASYMSRQHQTAFTAPSQSNSPYKLCWPKVKKVKLFVYLVTDHAIKLYGGRRNRTMNIKQQYYMDISAQVQPPPSSCFTSGERVPGIHRPGAWVGPRAGPNVVEK
jgi:hypothetical protein